MSSKTSIGDDGHEEESQGQNNNNNNDDNDNNELYAYGTPSSVEDAQQQSQKNRSQNETVKEPEAAGAAEKSRRKQQQQQQTGDNDHDREQASAPTTNKIRSSRRKANNQIKSTKQDKPDVRQKTREDYGSAAAAAAAAAAGGDRESAAGAPRTTMDNKAENDLEKKQSHRSLGGNSSPSGEDADGRQSPVEKKKSKRRSIKLSENKGGSAKLEKQSSQRSKASKRSITKTESSSGENKKQQPPPNNSEDTQTNHHQRIQKPRTENKADNDLSNTQSQRGQGGTGDEGGRQSSVLKQKTKSKERIKKSSSDEDASAQLAQRLKSQDEIDKEHAVKQSARAHGSTRSMVTSSRSAMRQEGTETQMTNNDASTQLAQRLQTQDDIDKEYATKQSGRAKQGGSAAARAGAARSQTLANEEESVDQTNWRAVSSRLLRIAGRFPSSASGQSSEEAAADGEIPSPMSLAQRTSSVPGAERVRGLDATSDDDEADLLDNLIEEQEVIAIPVASPVRDDAVEASMGDGTQADSLARREVPEQLARRLLSEGRLSVAYASGVEEMEEDAPKEDIDGSKRWLPRNAMIIGMLVFLLISSLIALIVLIFRLSDKEDPPQELSPTFAPTNEKFVAISRAIAPLVVDEASLFTEDTGQSLAFHWITEEDEYEYDWYDEEKVAQRFALATFFFAINDHDLEDAFELIGDRDECEWSDGHNIFEAHPETVVCRDGKAVQLSIEVLIGTIPPELSALSHLERLILSYNEERFFDDYDEIDSEGEDEPGTEEENIDEEGGGDQHDEEGGGDQHDDAVTDDYYFDEQHIDDHGYFVGLSGTIPNELTRITTLKELNLAHNSLTGPLPDDIGNWRELTSLDVRSNLLTDSIPSSIGELTKLTSLYLSELALNGPLPVTFSQLTLLTILDLEYNELTGAVPTELRKMVSLRNVWISSNFFRGNVEFLCALDLNIFEADCMDTHWPNVPAEMECQCCTFCCDSNDACLPH